MTDFYSQNRCVSSTRSHGPLLCAFCLSFHFKKSYFNQDLIYLLYFDLYLNNCYFTDKKIVFKEISRTLKYTNHR